MTRPKRKNLVIALSFADALGVVEQINRQGGVEAIPKSSLAPMVSSKTTSSLFERKVAALRSYGLVEVRGEEVSLTQLGRAYAVPVSSEARAETMLQAFRRVSLFNALLSRYNGNPLPEINEYFTNMVAETYDVPNDEAPKWVREFTHGARHLGVLVSEAGQDIVRLPGPPVGTPSTDAEGENDMSTVIGEQELVELRVSGGKSLLNMPAEISSSLLGESIEATKDALATMERKLKRIQEKENGSSEDS